MQRERPARVGHGPGRCYSHTDNRWIVLVSLSFVSLSIARDAVKNRRSLTPSTSSSGPTVKREGTPTDDLHATRRGGARREVSARVTLKGKTGEVFEGWALNVSKGGVRVILEEKVGLGTEYDVVLTSATVDAGASGCDSTKAPAHNVGRIVWVQEEPDGVIAGIEFCADPDADRDDP
jgi:hypothetical protein